MKTIKLIDLFKLINLKREEVDQDDALITDFENQIEEEFIEEETEIDLIQAIGLLAYQSHYVRILVTRELLKETHYSVHEFCKKQSIEISYGELIAISKACQKETLKQKKEVKLKLNNRNKEVKMFDIAVLKKIMHVK